MIHHNLRLAGPEHAGRIRAEVRVHKSGLLPSAQVISVVRCQDDHVLLLWGQAVPRLGLVVGTVGDADQGATGH